MSTAVMLNLLAITAWFASAVPRNFRQEGRNAWLLLLTGSGLVVAGLYVCSIREAPAPLWRSATALCLAGPSACLFHRSLRASRQSGLYLAFSGRVPRSLLDHGPYASIRHPLYTAYILLWLSMALHAWSAIVTIGVSWLSALYIVAAGIEERQLLRSDFGDEYRIYRKKTGAMIPKIWQP